MNSTWRNTPKGTYLYFNKVRIKKMKWGVSLGCRSISCFIAFTIFLFSCRTIKEADFTVRNSSLGTILPNLQGTIDLNNLKQNISYGDIKLTGYYNGVIKIKQDIDSQKLILVDRDLFLQEQKINTYADSFKIVIEDRNFNVKDYRVNPERYYTRAEFIPEERVDDVIKLFAKEMKNNIAQTDSELYGNIHFELLAFSEKRNPFLTFFSLWTLCVPTLIGVPLTCVNTSLEIQLTVFNRRNQTIGKYNGKGKGTAWIAMYWGYGSDGCRKSALLALSNAMESIKTEIKNDKNRIISGPPKK